MIAVINLLNQEISLLRVASYTEEEKITGNFSTEKKKGDSVIRELVKEWHIFSLNTGNGWAEGPRAGEGKRTG